MKFLLLFLPLYRVTRDAVDQIETDYSPESYGFDWSGIFSFVKWVLLVSAAVAVLIFAIIGIMVLVEMYKAERHWLRSVRHRSYRAAIRSTIREMVDEEMAHVRDNVRTEVRREIENYRIENDTLRRPLSPDLRKRS